MGILSTSSENFALLLFSNPALLVATLPGTGMHFRSKNANRRIEHLISTGLAIDIFSLLKKLIKIVHWVQLKMSGNPPTLVGGGIALSTQCLLIKKFIECLCDNFSYRSI